MAAQDKEEPTKSSDVISNQCLFILPVREVNLSQNKFKILPNNEHLLGKECYL